MKDLSRVLDLFDRLEVQRDQIEQWRSELALANKRADQQAERADDWQAKAVQLGERNQELGQQIVEQARTIAAQEQADLALIQDNNRLEALVTEKSIDYSNAMSQLIEAGKRIGPLELAEKERAEDKDRVRFLEALVNEHTSARIELGLTITTLREEQDAANDKLRDALGRLTGSLNDKTRLANEIEQLKRERDVLLKNAAEAIRDPGIPTTRELERLRRMEAALSVLPHPRGWSSDRIAQAIVEAGDLMSAHMKDSGLHGLAEDWEAARGLTI